MTKMKYYSFFLGMLASFVLPHYYMFSQTLNYQPFPEKFGRWKVEQRFINTSGGRDSVCWQVFETAGDTVLGSVTYKKVVSSAKCIPLPNGAKKLAFAYRNDIPGKKVFLVADSNGLLNGNLRKEYLWYDFNLKIGDTLKSMYAVKWTKSDVDYERITVSAIDSVFTCGAYHKRLRFKCGGGFNQRLIEGVGFEENFVETYIRCPFEPFYIYTTYFSCSPDAIATQEKIPLLSVYPNPASETIQLTYSGVVLEPSCELYIVDCVGKVLLRRAYQQQLIDVSELPNGLYLLAVRDRKGNTSTSKFIKCNADK